MRFDHFFEDKVAVYMLLELCDSGSLNDLIKRRKTLDEIEVRYYAQQLLDAVEYLHQHKVIHRDIKLGNILLTKDMRLKVGDFGLSAKLSTFEERRRTACGTPNYMAPELLINNADGHSFEVDIWAIGVVIYTLVFGRPPFEMEDVQTTY